MAKGTNKKQYKAGPRQISPQERMYGLRCQIMGLDALYLGALAELVERLEPESRELLSRDQGFKTMLEDVDSMRFRDKSLDPDHFIDLHRPPVSAILDEYCFAAASASALG